ncbi:hypothetical protein [Streptosporangium sandarakinum]|uniref:hypothetical protein n=1 Tax=Streptosporangium sandarakinum TaxID=1260955 RepID=UPI0033B2B539
MSIMLFFRFLSIGLLSGTVMAIPLVWFSRGDGFEHLRLSAIMGLDFGQFLAVPIVLAVGTWKVRSWSKRPRPAPPGFVLGGIAFAFGALVLTQAVASLRWLNGPASGVGDPDGEYVMAVLAVLLGAVTLLAGTVILINRGIALRRSRKAGVPALTNH